MKNTRKIKYFLEKEKLFGLIFASSDQTTPSIDPKLRNSILQEFKISYPDLENFNLNEYIQDFINGDLISDATAYQSYEKQRNLFAEEIARRKERYGWKGLQIREEDIWKRYETRKEGRFLELISALQKEKYIEIITLAKDGGFIIDVLQKFQDFIAEKNCYPTLEQNIQANVELIKKRKIEFTGEVAKLPSISLIAEKDKGFFMIDELKIPIAGIETAKYKLLECLVNPKLGLARPINDVYSTIKPYLRKESSNENDSYLSNGYKRDKVAGIVKELQRIFKKYKVNKKFQFKVSDKIWLNLR